MPMSFSDYINILSHRYITHEKKTCRDIPTYDIIDDVDYTSIKSMAIPGTQVGGTYHI